LSAGEELQESQKPASSGAGFIFVRWYFGGGPDPKASGPEDDSSNLRVNSLGQQNRQPIGRPLGERAAPGQPLWQRARVELIET
jgi:hypothetical protein